jgi:hypothetical protein
MKRAIQSVPRRVRNGFGTLVFCLLSMAGCSEGGASANGPETGLLDESDIVAIQKTAKTDKEFRAAIKKRTMEKAGIIVPTKPSGKMKKAH